jgi:hypothetical protein
VIVAGYEQEMEKFIHSNPGLHSRFTRFIQFPDYSPTQLCQIFSRMCRQHGLQAAPGLKERLIHYFHQVYAVRQKNFANARLVRNCFETVVHAQASRLANRSDLDAQTLSTLEAEDLAMPDPKEMEEYRQSGRGYIVRCTHCGAIYSWSPALNLIKGECAACHAIYDAEFGERVG